MKKSSFIITLICLISLASCHKSGMNLFRGEYSIKTSGNVTLNQIMHEGDTTQPVNYEAALPNDIGQMEISTLDKNADSVLVVMNIMGGEVIVAHASCDGDKIIFKDFKRNTLMFSVGDEININTEVKVSASGKMFEDNTIVIDMNYDGEATIDERDYKIHGNDIRMVANRN